MKTILNRNRYLTAIISIILILSVSAVAHSTGTNIKVGQYRVAMTFSPLSALAVWRSENGYQCRLANSSELPLLLEAIAGLSQKNAIAYIESVKQTRALTHAEQAECKRLSALLVLTVAPAKNNKRPTKDIKAIKYTKKYINSGAICEGALIKKYRYNQNWYKIQGRNETAICGEY